MKNFSVKKLLSSALCAATVISCAASPAQAVGTIGENSGFSEGAVIKSGKYLVSLVNNYKKNKTRIYRTKLNGKGAKLVAQTDIYNDAQLYTFKKKIYFRKGENIISYSPKSGKKSTAVKLDRENKFKLRDKKGFLINIKGICAEGFIVDYRKTGLTLVSFKGEKTVISPYDKTNTVYICSTGKYAFYYKVEKKQSSRYVLRVYRYDFAEKKTEALEKFSGIKKPSAKPDSANTYISKKKIVFTAGCSANGGFEGCLCSMNPDGSSVKKLKEDTAGNITPGKNCAYISYADVKGNYYLYKISPNGKLSAKVKYTSGNYPLISYTTSKNSAIAISVSRFNYGYNVYALGKIAKSKGRKIFDADSQIKNAYTGNVLVSPTISGSCGDITLLTYGIYCYAPDNSLEYVYKCETFLVNARTGKKIKIDK